MQNGNSPNFKTELTDYSVSSKETSEHDNLDVDALIVGAGFGMSHLR